MMRYDGIDSPPLIVYDEVRQYRLSTTNKDDDDNDDDDDAMMQ